MSCPFASLKGMTRRGFLKAAGGLVAAAGTGYGARYALDSSASADAPAQEGPIAFTGARQAGIVTSHGRRHTRSGLGRCAGPAAL
jgi:hypothetical protein